MKQVKKLESLKNEFFSKKLKIDKKGIKGGDGSNTNFTGLDRDLNFQ